MSEDSTKQWTYSMNKILWKNLKLYFLFYLWTCAK